MIPVAHASVSDSEIERFQAEQSPVEEKNAVYGLEHGGDDANEMKKEHDTARHQNFKHSASLSMMMNPMSRRPITSYSKIQREKEQALRQFNTCSVRHEVAAEIPLRQLSELWSPSTATKQQPRQQQHRTGKAMGHQNATVYTSVA